MHSSSVNLTPYSTITVDQAVVIFHIFGGEGSTTLYPHQRRISELERVRVRLNQSELSGDDGEGPDWTGGLQLQGGQEAVWGATGALRLQRLPQAAPGLVGRAVELHCVSQDLLAQVDAAGPHQQAALR